MPEVTCTGCFEPFRITEREYEEREVGARGEYRCGGCGLTPLVELARGRRVERALRRIIHEQEAANAGLQRQAVRQVRQGGADRHPPAAADRA